YEDNSLCVIDGISKDSKNYQVIDLEIVSNKRCQQSPNIYRELTEYRFCAKFPPEKTSCTFPVGTAVIQNDYMI
ncbi:hypothetical protein ILUMI_18915, partial [Ignelater luminosus]